MPDPTPALRAATETVRSYGIDPDRSDILQNGSTLVVRLTNTLVARVVQDTDGPRQGTEWFARENAIALHLTQQKAPVIPLHSDLPPGPHEYSGYPMNFWQFVTAVDEEVSPEQIGKTLRQCHEALSSFSGELPELAIISESLRLLDTLRDRQSFPEDDLNLLLGHLSRSIQILADLPHQPLHGDAHLGNLMNTTQGPLWTDWEDAFAGPVEWDVASAIWNIKLLDKDEAKAQRIVDSYQSEGVELNEDVLNQCLITRAAVITAWYPVLYPNPNAERQEKLRQRLDWLRRCD